MYGNPSDELRDLLDQFGAVYMKPFGGLRIADDELVLGKSLVAQDGEVLSREVGSRVSFKRQASH